MPQYQVSLQHDIPQGASVRNQVSMRQPGRSPAKTVMVYAVSAVSALLKVKNQLDREGLKPRIVAVREILRIDVDELTDDELTRLLTMYDHLDEPNDWDGIDIAEDDNDAQIVSNVCAAIRDSDLIPGLESSMCWNGEYVDYVMIEAYDDGEDLYRSFGSEPRGLFADSTVTSGWDGVLSLARGIIGEVSRRGML